MIGRVAVCVQEKLENPMEAVSCLAARFQERIDSHIDSIKKEHERFVAEIQKDEEEEEEECDDERILYSGQRNMLPWHNREEVRDQILRLSTDEATFYSKAPDDYAFRVASRKQLILELLEIDPNLNQMHAKTRMKEDEFWTNYFYRCAQLRRRTCEDESFPRAAVVEEFAENDDELPVRIIVEETSTPRRARDREDSEEDLDGRSSPGEEEENDELEAVDIDDPPEEQEDEKIEENDDDLDSWLDDEDFRNTTAQFAVLGADYDLCDDVFVVRDNI